jgi:hypothetical protein
MQTATHEARERFHPRVDAGFMVKVLVDGRALVHKARDLSMAGLFVVGPLRDPRQRLTLSIPLPGDREVVTTCQVRRVQDDGVAVEFDHVDWDDLFALARFLHPRLP